MDPPIQTLYFLSGGATILTLKNKTKREQMFVCTQARTYLNAAGAKAWLSFFKRESTPGNIVEPPDKTMFW